MAGPAVLLLRVGAAWALPGLGLLALPDGPASALCPYGLHTALTIEAVLPDGTCYSGVATVEEVTRPDILTEPTRGLLLDFGTAAPDLQAGTEIWLAAAQHAPFAGLL